MLSKQPSSDAHNHIYGPTEGYHYRIYMPVRGVVAVRRSLQRAAPLPDQSILHDQGSTQDSSHDRPGDWKEGDRGYCCNRTGGEYVCGRQYVYVHDRLRPFVWSRPVVPVYRYDYGEHCSNGGQPGAVHDCSSERLPWLCA